MALIVYYGNTAGSKALTREREGISQPQLFSLVCLKQFEMNDMTSLFLVSALLPAVYGNYPTLESYNRRKIKLLVSKIISRTCMPL